MTAPYRWLRAAHKIAPNGACFPIHRAIGKAVRRGQDPSLQIAERYVIIGENANFRQVCRGRIDASRAVFPIVRNIRAVATGGIVAVPTD